MLNVLGIEKIHNRRANQMNGSSVEGINPQATFARVLLCSFPVKSVLASLDGYEYSRGK